MNTIFNWRKHPYMVRFNLFLTIVVLIIWTAGCVSPSPGPSSEIWDWYDLDAIRDNLGGSYLLMDDLDSTTPGYAVVASPTADGEKGWEPIGTCDNPFTGAFDGQSYEISDLFISRPYEDCVGLFSSIAESGFIENVSLLDATVTGRDVVGGLLGVSYGDVTSSYSTGSVTGNEGVGGLMAINFGSLSGSYSSGTVTGGLYVGGLVGAMDGVGAISSSYSTASVSGTESVGGLVGVCFGSVSDSHSSGSVSGIGGVGGLAGGNFYGSVSNSYSDSGVSGIEAVGGLLGFNLGFVSDSHSSGSVTGTEDVGGLVGANYMFIIRGSLNNCHSSGSVTGNSSVGGLVGYNIGSVIDCYSSGSVTGTEDVGGLVAVNDGGIVRNSYYNHDVVLINGENIITIGALFGEYFSQWLADDKFLDVNERLAQEDGYYMVNNATDFRELLAFGQDDSLKFILKNDLDLVTQPNFYIPYLAGEFDGNGHIISNLSFSFDFVSQVGLFGYLDRSGNITQLGVENVNIAGSFATGGLAGGSRGTMSDSYASGSVIGGVAVGGLVGANSGNVTNSYFSGNVTGTGDVGGLAGWNGWGDNVATSYSIGSVTGDSSVGGLVGDNDGNVIDSYSGSSVAGGDVIGGLVGDNSGDVTGSYSSGNVTGIEDVGGLVGWNDGTVSNSFWDTETSGQPISSGGTSKNTTEMKDIDTFSGAGWNIIEVTDPATPNPDYIWNIPTTPPDYPFLSWQP